MTSIEPKLLNDYMSGFFGYGNLRGRFWFIGMEEGGGDSEEEIARRLSAWSQLGGSRTVDLLRFHEAIGEDRWFGKKARLQPTWAAIIRVMMSIKGIEGDNEAIREYQTDRLARENSDLALLELYPLPSPSSSHWIYANVTDNPNLISRRIYYRSLENGRIAALRTLIESYSPGVVTCYGLTHLKRWMNLIPAEMKIVSLDGAGVRFGTTSTTAFFIVQHPVARGVRNEYWKAIGKRIGELSRPELRNQML